MKSLLLMFAACLVLAACEPANKPVRLGFLAGMSGRSSDLGEAARNGVLLAIEQRNLAGGINGRTIELMIRDDRSKPEIAIKAVAEMVNSDVVAIIGPITSSMTEAVLPTVNAAKVILMSPTASSIQLAGRDDYLFRINASTRDYARMYANFHYRHTGLRRLAIAMDESNRAFSQSWLDEFKPAFNALGGEVTTVVPFRSSANVVFSGIMEQLLKSDPDGLLFIAGTVDVVRLAQQAKRQKSNLPLIAVEWAASEKLNELGGSAVEGLHVVESYNRNDNTSRYSAFLKAYRDRFLQEPGYTSVAGYDAAITILDALTRRSENQSLKDALRALGPFDGLQQSIRYDQYGDTTRKGYFLKMHEGRFLLLQ
jgi:branched-chain amino acid transport system substrate-binding protein